MKGSKNYAKHKIPSKSTDCKHKGGLKHEHNTNNQKQTSTNPTGNYRTTNPNRIHNSNKQIQPKQNNKAQLLTESSKQAIDLQDKAIKLSLEIDTLIKQQAAKEAKELQLAKTKLCLERVKQLKITSYSALLYHTGVVINGCVLTAHPELNSITKDMNNYYILNVETLPANTELSEKCLKAFNNPEIIDLGTLLTWLKAQQECLYAQNYSLLTPQYKLALHGIFIELIKPYKDIVTEYYETRKSNAMSSTLDIEFDNRL